MYIKEPTMIQLVKDVKLTFEDKLGIFGGTIGVFTGISFITMIEIAYWLIILVIGKYGNIKDKHSAKPTKTMVKKISISPASEKNTKDIKDLKI